jgi:hypothetical protein
VRALPRSPLSTWSCIVFLALLAAALPGASLGLTHSRASIAAAHAGVARQVSSTQRPCSRKATTRRYVSTGGSDRSRGTLRHPWRTIRKALRHAVPGQTVYVRSGTYPDWVFATRSGTDRSPISLRAYPGERPVMTGRLKIEGAFFCVRGLRFEGMTSANRTDPLIYVAGAQHVEILRNKILNAAVSGIYVGDEGDLSEDVSIISNEIRGNGTHDRFDHGIYLGHVRDGLIANNLVVDNRAIGVKIEPEANDMVVTQNTVADNRKDGIVVGGELNWSSNDNLVVNNIVAFNKVWGIRTYWEDSIGSGNRALRNLVYGNGEGNFWFLGGGLSAQRSIHVNPRFIGDGNYRLRAGSPALNRAIPTFSLGFDITGRVRPRGRADLGAFER